MGLLTIVYVVLAFRQDFAFGAESYAIWALALLFLLEFGARCFDSPDRVAYLRTHWLDLVTAVPIPSIPGLRILRLLRLLRLAKLGMMLRHKLMTRGWADTSLIWPSLVLFWLASGLALWLVEHDAPGATIKSFSEAMTASFITASTLGFGSHDQPVTMDGQIIAAVIVFMALGLWGFASGRITEVWLRGRNAKKDRELSLVLDELSSIRRELAAVVSLVERPAGAPTRGQLPMEARVRRQPELAGEATNADSVAVLARKNSAA